MAKTKSANHKSYRAAADKLFMPQFRGQPCEVCGKCEGTAGHHIVSKSRSKALRFDSKNIIVVCQSHHTYGNEMAPHAMNQLAVERFLEWFRVMHPNRHKWIVENERIERRYSYKDAIENMKAGREAWDNGIC